jgi:hypothetical protein
MTTIIKAKDGTDLDLGIVTLAKAIRQVESSNNYNSKGASGEGGAYQYMPSSWKEWAGKYLGDSNAPMTPVNQDKVAYYKIKELKDAGNSPSQVASIWNSGSPVWEGKVGVNSKGVKYDVPSYVNKVQTAYSNYKQLALASLPITGTNNVDANGNVVPEKIGFVQSLAQSIVKPFIQTGATVASLFKGISGLIGAGIDSALGNKELANIQIQEAGKPVEINAGWLGTQGPMGIDENGKPLSTSQTVKQAVGTGLEIAATLAPYGKVASVAEKTLVNIVPKAVANLGGKVIESSLLGYTYETGSDLSEDKSIAESLMPGGGTLLATAFPIAGAGVSVAGKKVANSVGYAWNKSSDVLSDVMPSWLKNKLPQNIQDDIQSAINSKFVLSSKKLITTIENKIATFNDSANTFFSNYSGNERISKVAIVQATQMRNATLKTFQDAGYETTDDVLKAVAKIVPDAEGILLSKKVWTMAEANRLRDKLLKAITTASKNSTELELAKSIFTSLNYTMLSKTANIIKTANDKAGTKYTQQQLSDLVAAFNNPNEIIKNYRLKESLKEILEKQKGDSISIYSLVNNFLTKQAMGVLGAITGGSVGGVLGGIAGYAAGEVAGSVANNFKFFVTDTGRVVATNDIKLIKKLLGNTFDEVSDSSTLKAGLGAVKKVKDAVKTAAYKETSDELQGKNNQNKIQ